MPHPPIEAVRLEEEIEAVIDQKLSIKADRSMWRRLADECTERLKDLNKIYVELEARREQLFGPYPSACAIA